MNRRNGSYDSDMKERSGWLLPSAVLIATLLLAAVFLIYYFVPNPASFIEEHASPTSRTDRIEIAVGGLRLRIPSNYLLYPSARRGGAQRDVALVAKLPDLQGYTDKAGGVFAGNGPNSPIVHILIRAEEFELSEAARLQRNYLERVQDAHGRPGGLGLVEYKFRDDSGYRDEDLFVGQLTRGPVVMRCERRDASVPSPNCLREMPLSERVSLSYRFKRARLAEWRNIAQGVGKLVASFLVPKK